jgi:hypothetical protein
MFPKTVFRDLGDLSSAIGTFKGVLPNEAEIIEMEFMKEIHSMKFVLVLYSRVGNLSKHARVR